MQVDAVEQRTGYARLIIGGSAFGRAAAGKTGLVGAAAAAGVHRRDQHEARRIGDAVIGARDETSPVSSGWRNESSACG